MITTTFTTTRYIDVTEIQGSSEAIAYVRGNIAAKSGDYSRAVAMYTDTLKQNPKHIRARLNRVSCYLGLNQALEAKEDADVLLSLAPQLKVAIFARGDAQTRLAEWEGAKEDLLVVLEDAPHHYKALTKLVMCYLALDRPERAEGPIDEALRLAPDFAEAWNQRVCFTLLGKRLRLLVTLRPQSVLMETTSKQESRLAIHHNFDNLEQAMAGWRGVLALDPNHAVARGVCNNASNFFRPHEHKRTPINDNGQG